MSKNTSPQARPSRRLRSRRRDSAVIGIDKKRQTKKAETPDRSDNKARLREFLPLVLIGNVIIVSFLIIVALAGLLLTNSSFVALPATIAQLWLVSNAAPVASVNAELGFVPLLPALGVIAVIAWRVFSVVKEKVSLADLTILTGCVLGVPLLLTLTALAMLLDASSVLPVAVPSVALSLGRTLLVHAVAMVVGMGPRLWRALERRYAPGWALVDTAHIALKFWGALFAVALVTLIALVGAHFDTVAQLYRQLGGGGSVAGLTALNVLYLPNLLVAVAAVLLGGEFGLGDGSVSLFGSYLVPLPPLPILAAVPGQMWEYAWLFLAVPLVLGAAVQFKHLRKAQRPFRDVGIAGLWSLLIALVLLAFTVGELGGYGVIGSVWWLMLGTAPLWIWLPGLAVAAVGWVVDSRAVEREDAGELVDEPLPEEAAEPEPEVGADEPAGTEESAEPAEPSDGEPESEPNLEADEEPEETEAEEAGDAK